MGKQTPGIYQQTNGRWEVDKWVDGIRLRERFDSYQDAQDWLSRRLEQRRQERVHGIRPTISFNEAAGRFLSEHSHLHSIESTSFHLKAVMPFIGQLPLEHVHDGSLKSFVEARLAEGRAHKTINLSLSAVSRILTLAARKWVDEKTGHPWLARDPLITKLDQRGHQKQPRPISWAEQAKLLPELPEHLREMSLFLLNSGVRQSVPCNLQWEWEIPVPELGISVFDVPPRWVKGRKEARFLVCNSVSQQVVERQRGKHPTHVFVVQTNGHPLGPIQDMYNTAWQNARVRAGLPTLRVHDLRHTVGMRLRQAKVDQVTISDVLWHTSGSMTEHYSVAQLHEIFNALEKITKPGSGDLSMQSIRLERAERRALLPQPGAASVDPRESASDAPKS